MAEIVNLGMAAGYWNLNADGRAGLYLGLRESEAIDDSEFWKGLGGMTFSAGERLITRTLPALYQNDILNATRAEFGIYPGITEMGIDVKQTRKKIKKRLEGNKKLSTKERKTALQSLLNY